jgi:hypothetical protein
MKAGGLQASRFEKARIGTSTDVALPGNLFTDDQRQGMPSGD